MKKISILILFIIVAITAFYTFNDTKTNSKTQVVFVTLQMDDFAPYINNVIKVFESQNNDISIKWIDVPFSEGEKRALASVLSENPPDLFNLNPDFSNILAQKGALHEIELDESNQFVPQILDSLRFDGKLYAIPWYATSAITIYNKELSQKADILTPPTTYEDLDNISSEIFEKTGAYAFMPTITENDTMLKILNKYGVNSFTNIDSQTSENVFEMFKRLYQNNLIPKESITQTHREALEKYMAENIVYFQSGANFLNMIAENAPEVYQKTDVAPQITGELGQYDFSLMNFVIPARAKNKDTALKFALFLTNDENQLELAKLTNIIAINNITLQNEYYTKYDENDLVAKARCISAQQLTNIHLVMKPIKFQKEVNLLINTGVQEILLDKLSTKSVLKRISEDWHALNE